MAYFESRRLIPSPGDAMEVVACEGELQMITGATSCFDGYYTCIENPADFDQQRLKVILSLSVGKRKALQFGKKMYVRTWLAKNENLGKEAAYMKTTRGRSTRELFSTQLPMGYILLQLVY
ncbi:hypothetical protein Aduo_018892 [Ancylostoma duodenale]